MTRDPAAPQVRAEVVPSDWDCYVERCGVLTASALMVGILALAASRSHPTAIGQALAGPQLLLVLVVLGCLTVLSYRSDPH
jgi:hypothetical protein